MKKKRLLIFAVVFIAMLNIPVFISSCSNSNKKVYNYAASNADAAVIAELEQYPNLQTVDLRGSDCYDAIIDYANAHPQISVLYDVPIGDERYSSDSSELTLADGEYDYSTLLSNLAYLPDVNKINLPNTSLSTEQLEEIKTAYPDLQLDYTVMVLGEETAQNVTELDLSSAEPEDLDTLMVSLSKMTNLVDIKLTAADGSNKFTPADVKKLMDAVPNATVHYTFELFGKTISTTDKTVEFVETNIGNNGVSKIREALDILPDCTYFKLDRCGIDNNVMEQLRDDYPEVKIVWRVFFARYNCLTDVEMLHCTGGITDSMAQVLKYCTDVVYLDIGHNRELSDISFINYMPKIKIAIIVDCRANTLEPFANCPDLERLEIVACTRISDLSPLANCKKLKGLNMSCALRVKDLSPLYGLQEMERLYLGQNKLPQGQYEAACENLPNCWVTNTAKSASQVSRNYAIGWRLNEDGSRADWYLEVRKIFRYDEHYYNHND